MTESGADVVVLRQKIHGMGADEYAEELRLRLPDHEIVQAETPADERRLLADAPVATGFALDPADLTETLEYFACVFAGTDHLPLEALAEHDIALTNAAGVHGPNVSEQVLGYLLTFARNLHEGWRRARNREWRSYQTRELTGSTVAVVGLGSLGRAVVERLQAFDVTTIGIRHSPEKGGPTDEVLGYDDDVHRAFARADYLVVTAPLTDLTEGLIDAEVFRTLPSDSVLVNVGRGPIIETDALVEALRGNAIRGAALDVTDPEPLPEEHPLWGFENIVITPHNAGHTPAYWERMAEIVAANVNRAEEQGGYEGLQNQVQF
ncbi:MAG: D-2-hydroxyacid dehydrogenase [Halodesulfurarchaeum sp.]